SPAVLLQNSLATGDLPTRGSVQALPGFADFNKKYPGAGTFAANLKNVLQARPQIAAYPRVSAALGREIVAALLRQASPRAALTSAARRADSSLSVSGWRPPDAHPACSPDPRVRSPGRLGVRVPRRVPDLRVRDRPGDLVRPAVVPAHQPAFRAAVGRL